MTTTPLKWIYQQTETGAQTDQPIAQMFPASQPGVSYVLSQPEGDEGRSEWFWFRLQNGDLILGVFPTGDYGYFGSEPFVEADYKAASEAQG